MTNINELLGYSRTHYDVSYSITHPDALRPYHAEPEPEYISAKLTARDGGSDRSTVVARASLYRIDIDVRDPAMILDNAGGDLLSYMPLYDGDNAPVDLLGLLIVDRVTVEERLRGFGLGPTAARSRDRAVDEHRDQLRRPNAERDRNSSRSSLRRAQGSDGQVGRAVGPVRVRTVRSCRCRPGCPADDVGLHRGRLAIGRAGSDHRSRTSRGGVVVSVELTYFGTCDGCGDVGPSGDSIESVLAASRSLGWTVTDDELLCLACVAEIDPIPLPKITVDRLMRRASRVDLERWSRRLPPCPVCGRGSGCVSRSGARANTHKAQREAIRAALRSGTVRPD